MNKIIQYIISSLFLLLPILVIGQETDNSCVYYDKYIKEGDKALRTKDFKKAINAYSIAMVHCPNRAQEPSDKIKRVFMAINQLRIEAEVAKLKAERSAKKAKELEESIKIIDKNASAYQFLFQHGVTFFEKGDFANALVYFANANFLNSNDSIKGWVKSTKMGIEAYENFSTGYPDKAKRTYAEIVKKHPIHSEYVIAQIKQVDWYYEVLENAVEEMGQPLHEIDSLDLSEKSLRTVSIDQLKHLRYLNLNGSELKNYRILKKLQRLRFLNLGESSIKNIDFLKEMPKLEMLNLNYAKIKNYSALEALPNLYSLSVSSCEIENAAFLKNLKGLKNLDISDNTVESYAVLSELTQLDTLDISLNMDIRDFSFFEQTPSIRHLNLRGNEFKNIDFLAKMPQLKMLEISDCQLINIEPMGKLINLVALDIGSNHTIKDYSPLGKLDQVTALYLVSSTIKDFSFLTEMSSLETLELDYNITDIDPQVLSQLVQLKTLRLSNNNIPNISFLKNLTQLETLDLNENAITDLTPLSSLSNLEYLILSNNSFKSIEALKGLTQLKGLDLYYCEIPVEEVRALEKKLPNTNILFQE